MAKREFKKTIEQCSRGNWGCCRIELLQMNLTDYIMQWQEGLTTVLKLSHYINKEIGLLTMNNYNILIKNFKLYIK